MIFLSRSLTLVNAPQAMKLRWMRENQFSTRFRHDEQVRVQWILARGLACKNAHTRSILWLLTLSQITWTSRPAGCETLTSSRKATDNSLLWVDADLPITSLVRVLSAANRLSGPLLSEPLRLNSKP